MHEIDSIISEINGAFARLFAEMNSGYNTIKCPYCKYDVYIHKSHFQEHLFGTHDIQRDTIIHKKGDLLDELR